MQGNWAALQIFTTWVSNLLHHRNFFISPGCHSTVPIGNANPNRKNPTHPEDVVIPQWLWSSKAPCKRQISIRRHRKELHLSINIDLNTTSEYRQQHSLLSIQLCNFHLCNQYLPLIQSWFVVAACWGGCSSHPSPLQLLPVPYEILRYSQAKPPWLAPCNTEEQQPYSNVSL